MFELQGESRRRPQPKARVNELGQPKWTASKAVSDESRWLLDLLWSMPERVEWAEKGALPAGYTACEQLALLPSGAGKTFSLSLGSRRGAFGCATAYGRLRPPRRRLERYVVGLGVLAGVVQRATHCVEVGMSWEAGPEDLLSHHLARVFGVERVVVGCGAGSGPYRKPVLQVFDTAGRPLGYVKVGWNDRSRAAVQREADALARMSDGSSTLLRVPGLISRHSWHGMELVVTAPLPRRIRRLQDNPVPTSEVLSAIVEQAPVHESPLRTSTWWRQLRERARTCSPTAGGGWLDNLVDETDELFGERRLAFGMSHGDFSPWNLGTVGASTYVWDWEDSHFAAPVGLDALHFIFQPHFVSRGRSVGEAQAVARQGARETLLRLGLRAEDHDLLSHLHLLDLMVRHEEAAAASGESDERFSAQAAPVLAARTQSRDAVAEISVRRSA